MSPPTRSGASRPTRPWAQMAASRRHGGRLWPPHEDVGHDQHRRLRRAARTATAGRRRWPRLGPRRAAGARRAETLLVAGGPTSRASATGPRHRSPRGSRKRYPVDASVHTGSTADDSSAAPAHRASAAPRRARADPVTHGRPRSQLVPLRRPQRRDQSEHAAHRDKREPEPRHQCPIDAFATSRPPRTTGPPTHQRVAATPDLRTQRRHLPTRPAPQQRLDVGPSRARGRDDRAVDVQFPREAQPREHPPHGRLPPPGKTPDLVDVRTAAHRSARRAAVRAGTPPRADPRAGRRRACGTSMRTRVQPNAQGPGVCEWRSPARAPATAAGSAGRGPAGVRGPARDRRRCATPAAAEPPETPLPDREPREPNQDAAGPEQDQPGQRREQARPTRLARQRHRGALDERGHAGGARGDREQERQHRHHARPRRRPTPPRLEQRRLTQLGRAAAARPRPAEHGGVNGPA